MAGIQLSVSKLLLDLENPRISKAGSQREALQKIIEDQDVKLVVLAESIIADRLSPMDRWLVIKSPTDSGKYTVLEGNRRLAAIRILNNPAVLDDLEVRPLIKKRFEVLAGQFELSSIEPIDCFQVIKREEAAIWINQRHTGENKGRGIVDWGGVATARFRGRDPALQALEFVLKFGDLNDEEKEIVQDHFPITTLDRLLGTPAVRSKIGVEVSSAKLKTNLPPSEVMRTLKKIVLDLANEVVNVTKLKSRDQQIAYISSLGKDLPDLSKGIGTTKSVDALAENDFDSTPQKIKSKPRPKRLPPARKSLVPRDCHLKLSNAKIGEIIKELRWLPLADSPHAISVLFRVFLEQSVDHYLSQESVSLHKMTPGGKVDKKLREKVEEAIEVMVKNGTDKKNLAGVSKGIADKHNPLHVDTLHAYVHNRFYAPTERDLKVAWDNAQLFFENIWK